MIRRASIAVAAAAIVALGAAPAADAGKRVVYNSPGYKGVRKAPKVVAAKPPPPIELSAAGKLPQVTVDAAGTAHIVWTEEGGDAPDVVRYCRLKRAATACDNPPGTQRLVPDQPYGPGAAPGFNEENSGARVVALGDELAILTHRYPIVTDKPDGTANDRTTYMFLSEDGGSSFSPPVIVGDAELSGGVTAYGPADSPQIGVISDTKTGGTFFQALAPGRYTGAEANLGGDGPDRAYSGSLTTVDGRPMAAFADLGSQTYIRQWSGQGDINDPATWSTTPTPGEEPRLASGPSGTFLMTKPGLGKPYEVRKLTGTTPGRATRLSEEGSAVARDIFEDAGGKVHAGWIDRDSGTALERTTTDGTTWSAPRALFQGNGMWQLDLGAAFDGGGVAVAVKDGQSVSPGKVVASAFGNKAATGFPGLGSLSGGGLPPGTVSSCQKIGFGAVDIRSPEGCFLGTTGSGSKGVKVSEGTLNLNGLEIVPDANVKIMLNAREKTLDTTGTVSVQLRGAGEPIVLFRGELHIRLPTGSAGTKLASFDTSKFGPVLKGFPIKGTIDVELLEKSVRIPVSLELPKAFGGIRGDAVLEADSTRGLRLQSLEVRAKTIPLGVALIEDLHVSWSQGDNWTGGAKATFPPGWSLEAEVRFTGGAFNGATISITPPFPGIPLWSGVYLSTVTGGFNLDPFTLEAGVRVGAIPIAPPDRYTVAVRGGIKLTFGDPFEIEVTGSGAIFGFEVVTVRLKMTSDLYFEMVGDVDLDLSIAAVKGGMSAVVDGPKGDWGGTISGDLRVFGADLVGVTAVLSKEGTGACGRILGAEAGFAYRWGGSIPSDVDTFWGSCDLPKAPKAGAAQAGPSGFSVRSGSTMESLTIFGADGPPSVVLVSPSGERITPAPDNAKALLAVSPSEKAIHVALPKPAAGAWRIEPQPGSTAVTNVEDRAALPAPKVTAKVSGTGATRRLAYTFANVQGREVRFFEKLRGGTKLIGTSKSSRGTLSFVPAGGPGGRRVIQAVVEQDGLPRRRLDVASYTAPRPPRPGRVSGAKATRKGSALTVSWKGASGASLYLVRVDVSDGRRMVFDTRARTLRVPGIAKGDKVTVSVTGRNRSGRNGPRAAVKVS